MNRFDTHAVENQVPPLEPYDAWTTDAALREALAREGGAWGENAVAAYGRLVGGEIMALGFEANRHKPVLRTHDRGGHRIDTVEFHPSYHRIMQLATKSGVHAFAWNSDREGAHVARAALVYLHHQAEQGTNCPLTMTYAAVPVLRQRPDLARVWVHGAVEMDYDERPLPAADKRALTLGMGMTEKQGGSDVRRNSTRATPDGDGYRLVGHKWFFSAPMSDGFLVLAQAEGGLTCFLLPRILPDGTRNAVRIQRLKDKVGNWSNASSEVEFADAFAWRVGDEGRGVATIIDMVALTRLDCMLGSAAQMRQAAVQAIHHARHRVAFGKKLAEQPLMTNVLADLALESEAAMALALRVARAVDAAPHDVDEAAFARIATAIGKYWICRRAPSVVNEAQECLGGAGYVEESLLARLYREAPLNSIWEGSGNVQCLDVLRALSREPATRAALQSELSAAKGVHPAYDAHLARVQAALEDADAPELRARTLVESLATALAAACVLRAQNGRVADAYCRSRLTGEHGMAMGTLPRDVDFAALIERAFPG